MEISKKDIRLTKINEMAQENIILSEQITKLTNLYAAALEQNGANQARIEDIEAILADYQVKVRNYAKFEDKNKELETESLEKDSQIEALSDKLRERGQKLENLYKKVVMVTKQNEHIRENTVSKTDHEAKIKELQSKLAAMRGDLNYYRSQVGYFCKKCSSTTSRQYASPAEQKGRTERKTQSTCGGK